ARVASSAMSEFRFEATQQLGVNAGVDFAPQDLLGRLDGQRGDLFAQRFARLHRFLLGLGLRRSDDLVAFFRRAALGFFDHRLREALGIGQALRRVGAGSRQLLLDTR